MFLANTTPTSVGDGFGADGVEYEKLVNAFRSGESTLPLGPYAYRVLAPGLVAASGLEPHLGFLALDLAAMFGSVLLLIVLLRMLGAGPGRTVLAVTWWSLLPFAFRYQIHYPALVDAPAFFLLLATLLAAMRRSAVLFALFLLLGVLTRENLVLLTPLYALRGLERRRDVVTAALASAPALVGLLLVHQFPPVLPLASSSSTLEFVAFQVDVMRRNTDDAAWRALAAFPLSLGLLISPLLASPRAVFRYLASQPGWTYLTIVLVLASMIGGRDNDRYLLTVSPIFLVVAFVPGALPWRTPLAGVVLTVLHLVASRALIPLTDATDLTVAWSPPRELWPTAVVVAILCIAGAVLWHAPAYLRSGSQVKREQQSRADHMPPVDERSDL